MTKEGKSPVLIAGAGIAGLTLAIALARRGISSHLYEQAPQLEAFGAGLQLSPNASHVLARLGVLSGLRPQAVQPQAVRLRDASTLRLLTSVPLGQEAERRWRAPYLVVHRADLQQALLAEAATWAEIELTKGMQFTALAAYAGGGIDARFIDQGGKTREVQGALLVGADGVWSKVRRNVPGSAQSRFSGQIAWRTTIKIDSEAGSAFCGLADTDCVTAFLHGDFHLVAYPLRAGAEINLVAFTPAERIAEGWAIHADPSILLQAVGRSAPQLARLVEIAGPWTAWPLHTVDPKGRWTAPGIALIGDAAHAVTPFAAQGAAMAIEDAVTLAHSLATASNTREELSRWEEGRKARVSRVAKRGALNKLAWNAAGPVALARNVVLGLRSPERLAADLDWLYGWRLPQAELEI